MRNSNTPRSSTIKNYETIPKVYGNYCTWLSKQISETGLNSKGAEQMSLTYACIVILVLSGLQQLKNLSNTEIEALGTYLLKYQDSHHGLFKYSLFGQSKRESDDHNFKHKSYKSTYFALHALDALGIKAQRPLNFMDGYKNKEDVLQWVESSSWLDKPTEADELMLKNFFLVYRSEIEMNESAPMQLHKILDWLDQNQDPKTGLWSNQKSVPIQSSIKIAYRLIPFFEYLNRPLRRVRQIIDTALHLTQTDGSLITPNGRDPFGDLSAIYLLSSFTRKVSHRSDEIRKALVQSYWSLRDMQNSDGSFSDTKLEDSGMVEFNGVLDVGLEDYKGSAYTNFIRLISLATLERMYPKYVPRTVNWKFSRWPTIGYLKFSDKLSDHEQNVLRLWIRPTAYDQPKTNKFPIKHPAISVIIPCYNLGCYLHETLESVYAQTSQDFEVLIVDDGSTDEYTRSLLENLDRPRTEIIHQTNQGLAAARNNGIRASSGKYICCLDADDLISPRFFEKALPILDNNPRVGFVTGHMQEFDDSEAIHVYENCNFPDLLVYNHVIVPALFRKEAWEKVGGYYGGFITSGIEDWDLWISILELGYSGEIIPEVLFDYRVRPDSMARTMTRPEYWGTLIEQLVTRHEKTYRDNMVDVLAGGAVELAKQIQWTRDRENAINWWERQSRNWQHTAELQQANFESVTRELKGNIDKLQRSFWVRLGLKFGFIKKNNVA